MYRYITKYYLNNYIHLSICVGLLTIFGYESTDTPLDWGYIAFSMLGTILLYNYHYFISEYGIQFWKIKHLKDLIVPLLLVILCLYFLRNIMMATWVFIIISGVASLLYFFPFSEEKIVFREVGFLKIFLIALVFGLVTTVIPLLTGPYQSTDIMWLFLARMMFVAALAISFDVGDMLIDAKNKLSTIPAKIGAKKSKLIAISLLFGACLIDLYATSQYLTNVVGLASLVLVYTASSYFIFISSKHKTKTYYLFVIDGMMALPFIFYHLLYLL